MPVKQKNQYGAIVWELLLFLLVIILVVSVWWFLWGWVDSNVSSVNSKLSDEEVRGLFGDKFGAINALFSGLAFAGIILTLLLQRRDLSETKKAMRLENFNNTFFQLLNLHIDIVKNLSAGPHNGRQAFDAFNSHLIASDQDFSAYYALKKIPREDVSLIINDEALIENYSQVLSSAEIANLKEARMAGTGAFLRFLDDVVDMHERKFVAAYKKSASQYADHFSHYFRNLYHILKFLDKSNFISEDEKKEYSKFVRSQLSDSELVCIFYNSICQIDIEGRSNMELGYPKMRVLIERFGILKNMNPHSIIHPIHQRIFDKNKGV